MYDPYDRSSLINQIGDKISSEEESSVWSEISNKLKECEYIDPAQIKAANSNELMCLSYNIRSLYKNIDTIRENISHFSKFDVICFSETSCDIDSLPNGITDILLENFHAPVIQKPVRSSNRGGGLACYINKRVCGEDGIQSISFPGNESSELSCESQAVKIEICLHGSNKKYTHYLVNCYRSPSGNVDKYFEQFEAILSHFDKYKDKSVTILGDINIDLLKYNSESSSTATRQIEKSTSHGYIQIISRPTRVTDHCATLIDHIYTNKIQDVLRSGVITYDISDHLGTFVTFSLDGTANTEQDADFQEEYHQFNDQNLKNFKRLIGLQDWSSVTLENDPQLKYDTFLIIYNRLYTEAFPLASQKGKNRRLNPKPWILPWLEDACKRKNSLYYGFSSNPSTENKEKYERMKKFVAKHVRKAKIKYYRKYFEQYSCNSRMQWQMLNQLTNRNTKKRGKINLKSDSNTSLNSQSITETFNEYFTTIADKLKSDLHRNEGKNTNFSDHLSNRVTNSIFLRPTSSAEISNHVMSLKNKSTSDTKVSALKIASSITTFSETLSDIVSCSFEQGTFPSQLKLAKVVPIHKNGSKSVVSNYRPISLLSIFSKIFEKAMHTRVYEFLQLNGSLCENQYGFRKARSCEHALLVAQNEILNALNRKKIALLLLIDFSKAFDMVDHDILLSKLEHYGIRGVANKWFASYLKGRHQYVSVNGCKSAVRPLQYSVPQGSILGPLLFIIYINDLPNISKLAKFVLYADDANIIITGDSVEEVTEVYNSVSKILLEWVQNNGLLLNVKKTNYMIFTRKRNSGTNSMSLKLGNNEIERTKVARFLGVLVDDKLSWEHHIKAVRNKMARYIGTIFRIKHMLPMKCRILTFNSLVMSHINFCSLIWGATNKSKIEMLFTVQKKAVRAIMNGPVNLYYSEGELPTHTKPAFLELGIPTVQNIIVKNMLTFARKLHFPCELPDSVRHIISDDSPCYVENASYDSDWYNKYSKTPYNTSVQFKAPLFHEALKLQVLDGAIRYKSYTSSITPNSYKNSITRLIHRVQSEGSQIEWENTNFLLYMSIGLRKSNRLISQPTVDYSNS